MADNQTQKIPEIQVTVDELSNKIKETTNELNQLKNGLNNLSLEQQNDKLSDIENAILECSDDLATLEKDGSASVSKSQLDTLKSQINTLTSAKEALQKQIADQAKREIDNLRGNISQAQNNGESKEGENQEGGKKKSRKWLRIGGGILAGWGIFRLGKRMFSKNYDYEKEIPGYSGMTRKQRRLERKKLKQKKRAEKKSQRRSEKGEFRQRPFGKFVKGVGIFAGVGSGIYYLAHGIYTKNRGLKDLFDREKGKKLSFKDAMAVAEGNIANQKDDKSMSYDIELKYLEESSEIEAYGQKVKVNLKDRTIEGLGSPAIKFKKYEHMISAAIVVAYLKKNLSGKCSTNTPFNWSGTRRGNLNADGNKVVDGTGISGMVTGVSVAGVLAIVSGIFGGLPAGAVVGTAGGVLGAAIGHSIDADNILNNYMPELDSEYGLKSLAAYLNRQDCWQKRNQTKEDITESPIKDEVVECMKNIQDTHKELESRGARRGIDAIQDPNDEKKYTIKAYGRDFSAEVTGNKGDRKIKILGISGGNPTIKTDMEESGLSTLELPLKEGLYMSSLLGYLLDTFAHKGNEYPRFTYGAQLWNSIRSGMGVRGDRKGLFFSDEKLDTYVLTERVFEERMPTLFKDENRDRFVKFLNDGIKSDTNESIWKK